MRLLSLPDEVLLFVEQGHLSAGHARSLIGLQSSAELAKKIIQKKLSVRQAEVLARQFRNRKIKLVHKKDINIFLVGSANHRRNAQKQVNTDEIIRKIFLFFKISE